MLMGRSSKGSSRGSEGRTRTGRAIFALRPARFSETDFSSFSGMLAFELEFNRTETARGAPVNRQAAAPNLIAWTRSKTVAKIEGTGKTDGRENSQGRGGLEETTHVESILCD